MFPGLGFFNPQLTGFLSDRPWSPAPAVSWTSALLSSFQLVLCQRLPLVPAMAVPNLHHSLLILSRCSPSYALGTRSSWGALPLLTLSPSSLTYSFLSIQGQRQSWPPPLQLLSLLNPFSPFHLPHHLAFLLLTSQCPSGPLLSLLQSIYSRKKRCRLCLYHPFMPPSIVV